MMIGNALAILIFIYLFDRDKWEQSTCTTLQHS